MISPLLEPQSEEPSADAVPVLVVVDEDPDALAAIETQLVDRYGRDYRVACVADRDAARALLAELADAGDEVALVLAAEPLDRAPGPEVLDDARRLHPHARRALLVSPAARTDERGAVAIRRKLASGRADHFLLRPAGARDEAFHEVLSSFLLEWARERQRVPQTVHIVGEAWSGRAFELREVFERCAVPHVFCLADSDRGRELLARTEPGSKLPLMVMPDGSVLSDPSNAEIAAAAGAPVDFEAQTFDLAIVGAGPAGLSAAVYGASEGLRVLVVDSGGIGGQARSSALIRNYLGFARGVSGSRLAEQAYEQASVFGAGFVFMHGATRLRRTGDGQDLSLASGRSVSARTVLLATGASYRRLGVEALEALTGAGVFYGGAASEAVALHGKDVYVVGGGNSAGQAALHLARYARRVTLVLRAHSLEVGMSNYLIQAIEAAPNVEVRLRTAVVGGGGDGRLERLVLRERGSGAEKTVSADALFVLIGVRPQTAWLPPDVARDTDGFLLTGDELDDSAWPLQRRPFPLETSMPGVFAAGDVRRASVKRVASAVGDGAIAVRLIQSFLADGWADATDAPLPAASAA